MAMGEPGSLDSQRCPKLSLSISLLREAEAWAPWSPDRC